MEKEQNIGIKITKNGQNGLNLAFSMQNGAPSWKKKYTAAGISGSND